MRQKFLKILMLIAIIALLAVSARAADEGAAPIAHWRFDEGGGPTAYDESSNNNDGTLQADTKFVAGKIGAALEFDGTGDYVSYGSTGLPTAVPATFEAWVNLDSLSQNGIVLSYSNTLAFAFGIHSDGILAGISSNKVGVVTPSSVLTQGQWHHWAVVYTSTSDIKLYIDGVDVSSTTTNYYLAANNNIGARANGTLYPLDGKVDDVRIYNYARTAAQIKQDYNNGMAVRLAVGTDPNEGNAPILYLSFDENTGATAYDRSGGGANATFTNLEATDWTSGKYGSSIEFNTGSGGTDEQITGTVSTTNPTNYTTMAWVYLTAYPPSENSNILRIGGRYLSINANKKFYTYCYGLTSAGYHASNSELPLNKWVHLAHVWDGSDIRMYIDGRLDRAISNGGSPNQSMGFYDIGCEGTDRELFGKVDEVKVYDYARTAAQVAYDYNKGRPVAHYKFDEGTGTIAHNEYSNAHDGAAPVGWWRMDEGTGTACADSSGNSLTATANAATWTSGKIGPYGLNNTYATISDNSLLEGMSSLTMSVWVYPTALAGTDRHIIDKGNWDSSPPMSYRLMYQTDWGSGTGYPNGYWRFHIKTSAGDYSADGPNGVSADRDNMWHYIVGVYDNAAGKVRIYDNGVLIGESNASGTINANTYNTRIWLASSGIVDDVCIYDYARTQEQIYNDYKSTHATFVGDTKFVDGKLGKALEFDGTGDCIQGPLGFKIGNAKQKTIEAWYNGSGCIVSMTRHNNDYMWQQTSTGQAQYMSGSGYNLRYYYSGIPTSGWHHLADVVDVTQSAGNRVKRYIDGVLITPSSMQTDDSNDFYDGNDLYIDIGRMYYDTPGDYFNGQIDDVRIYGYARTQAQIAEDYTAGAARLGAQVSGEKDPWGGALPVAHWKLDENTGVLVSDASGNGNDGTLVGDPTWTQGKLGPCLNFDSIGDAVKALSLSPSIAGTDSYSVSLWAKRSGLTGTYTFMWEGQTGSRPSLESAGDSTSYLFYVNGNSSISTGPLADDVWYHIVAVYDKTAQQQKLFVNSVSKGTNSIDASDSMTSFYIGSRGGTGLWFNGLLDDVRVYKYALTQAQVAWLYNKGKPVGHWRFNESSGTDAWDDSGNNNGTITIGGTGSQTTIAQARTAGATGKFGRCLSLDGTNDYVDCGNDASLVMGTGDFTIEAWINSDVLYGPTWSDPVGCIVQTRDLNSGSVQDGYYLGIAVSTIFFQIGDGTVNNGDFRVSYTDIGNWHHVVATRDAGSLFKLYIDGEFKGQDSDPCGDVGNTTNFHIGSRNAGSHFWDGLIDDVRVYNYVRTTAQIKEDYNNGLAVRLGD